MKVIRHGDNLWQLMRLHLMNCYLVREDDGYTLVDTNLPGSTGAILKAARAQGLKIVRVVLTHAHGDHVGSVDALKARLPDLEVMVTARDARFMTGDFSLDTGEPQADLRGSFPAVKTRPTRFLRHSGRVGSLEVVSSPGHTPGHVSFLDRRDGTLIAGDAFSTRDGVAVAGILRPLFPLPALATWHKPTALESGLALRELRPERLATGHGPVITNPLSKMDGALSEAQRQVMGY
ncbi:MAG: MBL fold metallo-hydrolase [Chloroflexota bacterium]